MALQGVGDAARVPTGELAKPGVAAKAADAPANAGDAKDKAPADVNIALQPGQAANIALEKPVDGKGGPQDPQNPDIKEEIKKLLTDLLDVLKKLTAQIEALLGGKGGPAPTQPQTAPKAAEDPNSKPKAGGPASFADLQNAFGQWKGKGKNSSAPKGPKATALVNSAVKKYSQGDIEGAKQDYSKAQQTGSPVMLDLNGDGKLGTTGVSTAKDRADNQVGKTVAFDLDGDGRKEQVEWADGKGDGFLVDDSDGGATRAAAGDGQIDGTRLFGDQGGKFANGYDKLKKFDADGDGVLRGQELAGLKMWVDNGDASVGGGELKSLADLGITEISVGMQTVKNARGEDLMRSTYTQNGQTRTSEDVWFVKR
ncbi:MAG: hypothetical protein FJZ01_09760 [Candidatus Sericytochromatia bacterium]|nr:hypothetical protein [Candidatus Tanganyikabacteria bacterium]